jgi:hypothetical protein
VTRSTFPDHTETILTFHPNFSRATGLAYWLKTKEQLTARFIMTKPLARILKGRISTV